MTILVGLELPADDTSPLLRTVNDCAVFPGTMDLMGDDMLRNLVGVIGVLTGDNTVRT